MQTVRCARLPGMILALLLTLLMGSAGADIYTISGTWRANVTLINCESGLPLPIPHSPTMNTFLSNGSLLSALARSDASAGHGRWVRTGLKTFESRLQIFRFASDGTYIGTTEVTRHSRFVTPDTFTSTATAEFFDVNGNPAGNSCATETAERFE